MRHISSLTELVGTSPAVARLTHIGRAVYAELLEAAQDAGHDVRRRPALVIASDRDLADAAACHPRSIYNARRQLIAAGLVRVDTMGSGHASTRYELLPTLRSVA
jgi:hypothetical protein